MELAELMLKFKKDVFYNSEDEIEPANFVTDLKNILEYMYKNWHRFIDIDKFKNELAKGSKI